MNKNSENKNKWNRNLPIKIKKTGNNGIPHQEFFICLSQPKMEYAAQNVNTETKQESRRAYGTADEAL